MTEFAYSGVGANPHFGTPGNPADRTRVPGGSIVGRRGRRRRRHVRHRDRQRHRRLDAHPGRALRHRRLQAEPPARADDGRVSAVVHARFHRPDGALGAGLRQRRRGDGGRDAARARTRAACEFAHRHRARRAARPARRHGRQSASPPRSIAWKKPACVCRRKSCRCSTRWPRSMPKAACCRRKRWRSIATVSPAAATRSIPMCACGSSARKKSPPQITST